MVSFVKVPNLIGGCAVNIRGYKVPLKALVNDFVFPLKSLIMMASVSTAAPFISFIITIIHHEAFNMALRSLSRSPGLPISRIHSRSSQQAATKVSAQVTEPQRCPR